MKNLTILVVIAVMMLCVSVEGKVNNRLHSLSNEMEQEHDYGTSTSAGTTTNARLTKFDSKMVVMGLVMLIASVMVL